MTTARPPVAVRYRSRVALRLGEGQTAGIDGGRAPGPRGVRADGGRLLKPLRMPRTVLLAFASLLVLVPLKAGLAGAAEPVRPAAASEVPAAADVRRHLDAALAEATQVSRKTAVTAAFGEYVALSRTLP